MMLFLQSLPAGTRREDLERFIIGRLRSGLFNRLMRPRVEKVEILRFQDPADGRPEFHGLIRILPNHLGKSVARQLNGTLFRGLRLSARIYVGRRDRDRRSAYTDPRLLPFADRRKTERRRAEVLIKSVRPPDQRGAGGEVFNARPRYSYAWRERAQARSWGDTRNPGPL
jgi:hypothetical protein